MELFEALRGIMLDLQCEPELSESDKSSLKAKLIALAVSSVSSDYRSYLIQAVMGLVAYLGHEAEKARDETLSTTAQQQPGQPSSELMSCKSLGVVLGPLLLGSMTDNTNYGANEVQVNARPPSTESAKKFGKKHKRKKSDKDPKLDQNAALSALVDRANLTASVMQSLLLIWPDVVKQLREINSTTGSASQLGTPNQVKKISSQALSRLTMKTSEEDVVFLDILRGRTLPDEFRGAVHMTRKVRISSRSPISRGSIKVSDDDSTNRTWLPTASEQIGDARSGDRGAVGSAEQDIGHPVDIGPLFSNARRVPTVEQYGALDSRKRTPSDVAVDHMSMGTILPLLQNSPISSEHTRLLPRVSPVRTPPYKSISRSTSESPETAVKDVSRAERSGTSDAIFFMSNDKPLPPIGDAQRAELSAPPTSDDDSDVPLAISSSRSQSRQGAEKARFPITQSGQWTPTNQPDESNPFPPRQSSLPLEKHLPMRPIETYESLADYKARSNSHLSPPKPKCSRESSSMYSTQEEAPVVPYQSGVKFLAQRFAEASRLKRNGDGQAKDNTTPRVYTYVRSLSSPISSDPDDPFISPSSNSAEREKASLIPKPVQEVGRGRRAESRSPSPPKRAAPTVFRHKRSSMFHIIPDRDADIVQKNTVLGPPVATTNNKRNAAPSRDSGQTSSYLLDKTLTRSLSTYSAESLRRLGTSHEEEDIPVAPHVAERTISFARSDSPLRSDSPSHSDSHHLSDVPARTNSFLSASDALKPLERRGSMNTTLYNEICRLQRLLKQKGEEVQTTRRSLDAVRDSKECATVAAERSRSKGTLSDEVREARKELGVWRRRAEWAERRLAGMGDLAATAGDDKSQKVKIVGPRTRGGEDCERERVELDRGRRMERGPGERERGARGSCRDDHGSCDLDSDF